MKGLPCDLRAFLEYLNGIVPDNQFVNDLDDEVKKARANMEWRREYVTLLMRDQENFEKGLQRGRELERENTERALRNAERALQSEERALQSEERARRRAEAAEAEVARLKALLEQRDGI